jgi:hypothetical protein
MGLYEASLRHPQLATAMFDDLQVVIPFRDPRMSKEALLYAVEFVEKQNAQVCFVDVQVVPHGIPLDQARRDSRYRNRRLKTLAHKINLAVSIEVTYARHWEQGFRRMLPPGSVVLFPIRRGQWSTREKRLATRLRKLGHTVIWVDCD